MTGVAKCGISGTLLTKRMKLINPISMPPGRSGYLLMIEGKATSKRFFS